MRLYRNEFDTGIPSREKFRRKIIESRIESMLAHVRLFFFFFFFWQKSSTLTVHDHHHLYVISLVTTVPRSLFPGDLKIWNIGGRGSKTGETFGRLATGQRASSVDTTKRRYVTPRCRNRGEEKAVTRVPLFFFFLFPPFSIAVAFSSPRLTIK